MDPDLYQSILQRLDSQDTALLRIESKLNATCANTASIIWLKWIVGGAWMALLALFGLQYR